MSETAFPISDRNRLKRAHERGSYDHATVFAILDSQMLCHVAYVIDGQPYCTPTLFWREGQTLYWHGSSASRMLRHLRVGTPTCLTVAQLDGLVLARSGFNHSANYRSAMCFGTARLVEDMALKEHALLAVVDRFYPNRSAALRAMTAQEIKATSVIAMPIEQASAKVRAKNVGDDEVDGQHPVWAGVLPVSTIVGAEQPSPALLAGLERPTNLDAYAPGRRLDEVLIEMQAAYEDAH
ncbi:pyridoxamine 5'-phosphate oxidase family protein [Arboricoccus pini]|nr:pyridoxamine 5'-phosphate oxidase family protein [Arboricoccus pini]